MNQRAVFLDKDGTLLEDVPYNVEPRLMRLADHAEEALRLLAPHYRLVVISNQSGVAHGYFPESALPGVERQLRSLLDACGVKLDGFYYCPHHPQGSVAAYRLTCECRKPRPGMLNKAARDLNIDLNRSWMVGDILDDIEAGRRAGCRTVLIDNGGETQWQISDIRRPDFTADDLLSVAEFILRATAQETPTVAGAEPRRTSPLASSHSRGDAPAAQPPRHRRGKALRPKSFSGAALPQPPLVCKSEGKGTDDE